MTTEQMNGNEQSEIVSQSWIQTQRNRLDEWDIKIGLPKFQPPAGKNDAIRLMENSSQDRQKMTPDECADAAVTLAQYGAYIARASQILESESSLLKDQIIRVLADSVPNQKAYSPEERRTLALCENDECYQMEADRIATVTKAKRLYFYAEKIDKVARAYENLSNTRKRERQNGY